MFRVTGGGKLSGEVEIGSAKNAVLPILAASILTKDAVVIEDFPDMLDTHNMLDILRTLGCVCEQNGDRVTIDSRYADTSEMPEMLSKTLRSSIFLMGPMLGRFGRATVTYPGGCEIGQRPIDLHLKGLRALGVRITESHGMIYCDGRALTGAEIHLDFPSVGATENIMLASVLAKGRTTISNPAREPEIVDLERFVNMLGGRVAGAGTDRITVDGVDALGGCTIRPIPDRIIAGTLLVAAAITGSTVTIKNARAAHMTAVLDKLKRAGCELTIDARGIALCGPKQLKPIEISTHPFPGFPTDMQAQMMAMTCVAAGTSVVIENVFENRFAHTAELRRMGADVIVSDRMAVVRGGRLLGARVSARDLRGGAALVLAGLAADGVTEIENAELIDRGYPALEKTIRALGGQMTRIR